MFGRDVLIKEYMPLKWLSLHEGKEGPDLLPMKDRVFPLPQAGYVWPP
jgi:hypothetical protein